MTSKYNKLLGEKVRSARRKKNMSEEDLAWELSILLVTLGTLQDGTAVTKRTICNYEKGTTLISFERTLALAAILNLDFDDFIPRELANTLCRN